MTEAEKIQAKGRFKRGLEACLAWLKNELVDADGNWKVRGFIDIEKKVYSLTSDTKVISKLFEINLLPYLLL